MSKTRRWFVDHTPTQIGDGYIRSISELLKAQLSEDDAFFVVEATAFDEMSARLEEAEQHLRLALSFAPSGAVVKGLDPTFYHTLSYETEVELQARVDRAREYFKKYEVK